MKKCILISLVLSFSLFLFISSNCYSKTLVEITGKWLYYRAPGRIKMSVKGIDEMGFEYTESQWLSKEEFFPNGDIYTYCMFNSYEWYACELIHKKKGKYYVVGFAVFELYFDDDKELKAILTPSFLFDWGMRAYTSKFYMDIDYKRCSEIQKEYIKPFSWKRIQEKYIYDKLHGNVPSENSQNAEQISNMEDFKEMIQSLSSE